MCSVGASGRPRAGCQRSCRRASDEALFPVQWLLHLAMAATGRGCAGIHSFTESLRVQMEHAGVRVVELLPPGVGTPLFRNEEFEKEMKVPKGMDVEVYARKAIASIEAGKIDVRSGMANVLQIMSRLAPG